MHFDAEGYPCPPLLAVSDFAAFAQDHVAAHPKSMTRSVIFSGYERYVRDFRAVLGVGFKQWVNGSFTTAKINPKDIDIINFVAHNHATDALLPFQTNGGSRDTFHVDAYIIPVYPKESPRYINVTLLLACDWASRFGFDEISGQEKVVIELLFS